MLGMAEARRHDACRPRLYWNLQANQCPFLDSEGQLAYSRAARMKNKNLVAVAACVCSVVSAKGAFAVSLTDSSAGVKVLAGADVWSTPSNPPGEGELGLAGNAGGFSYGLAGYYELRIIKLIGLEADLAYQHGSFHRNVTRNGVKFTETLTINSWRLPILAKLNLPLPLGRVWFGLGPEFTIAASSSGEVESSGVKTTGQTRAMKPTYGTGGLGLVIEMPLTGIEIPIELRASKNLSQPDAWADRYEQDGRIKAESSWVYRLGVGLGFSF